MLLLLLCFLFRAAPAAYVSSRLGVQSELQLQACATATATTTAMQNLICVCKLHLSLQQRQILNPMSEARDPTHILMDTSWAHNLLSHNRNS